MASMLVPFASKGAWVEWKLDGHEAIEHSSTTIAYYRCPGKIGVDMLGFAYRKSCSCQFETNVPQHGVNATLRGIVHKEFMTSG